MTEEEYFEYKVARDEAKDDNWTTFFILIGVMAIFPMKWWIFAGFVAGGIYGYFKAYFKASLNNEG